MLKTCQFCGARTTILLHFGDRRVCQNCYHSNVARVAIREEIVTTQSLKENPHYDHAYRLALAGVGRY